MAVKNVRQKGHTWERRLVKLLKPVFGKEVRRGYQNTYGGRVAGEGCDVEGTPFFVEAKHHRLTDPRKALRQARMVLGKRHDPRPPVAICKDDKPPPGWSVGEALEPAHVTMEFRHWLWLVRDWARLKQLCNENLEVGEDEVYR